MGRAGKACESFPAVSHDLREVEPVYETLPGWKSPTEGVTELDDRDDLVSFLGRADQFLYNQRSKREQELTGVAVVLPLGGRTDATQRAARARRAE